MTRTLFRNAHLMGPVPSPLPADRTGLPTAVAVEDGRIAWLGEEDRADAWAGADRVIDLHGDALGPGFVDAHTHTVQTGFVETGLDLTGSRSREEVLDRLAAHAQRAADGTVVVGNGWDETTWADSRIPTADELERAAPGLRVALGRIDGHSSVVSHALAAGVPGLEAMAGWTADGRVEGAARHAVETILGSLIGPEQRLEAARAACRVQAAHGVVAFHENAAPHIGPEYELDLVRQAADEAGLHTTLYWGELGALDAAQRLGVAGLAGDLNVDGAVGSHTCALRQPYTDAPGRTGNAYLSAEQVAEHVLLCTEHGLQAGFHCIGDAGMDTVAAGFRLAVERVGKQRLRAARHRLEHVEMPSDEVIGTLADLRVTASVQPVFDRLWGGPDQMYAERLGERWRTMNRFRSLHSAGVPLAFGSDSPVTRINPWAAVRAAVHHHDPEQRLSVAIAHAAHTEGGWMAAGHDRRGWPCVGAPADLAVWHLPAGVDEGRGGFPVLAPDTELPRLRLTMAGGRIIHEEDA